MSSNAKRVKVDGAIHTLNEVYEKKDIFVGRVLPFLSITKIFHSAAILSKEVSTMIHHETFYREIIKCHYHLLFHDGIYDLESQFRRLMTKRRSPYKFLMIFLYQQIDVMKPLKIKKFIKTFDDLLTEITSKGINPGTKDYRKKSRKMSKKVAKFKNTLIPMDSNSYQQKRFIVYDINRKKLFKIRHDDNSIKEVKKPEKLSKYRIYQCCDLKIFGTSEIYERTLNASTGLPGGARTMQTARKSTGGRAPRKQLSTRYSRLKKKKPRVPKLYPHFNKFSQRSQFQTGSMGGMYLPEKQKIFGAKLNLLSTKTYYLGEIFEISTIYSVGKKLILRSSEKKNIWFFQSKHLGRDERNEINKDLVDLRTSKYSKNTVVFDRERMLYFPFVNM